MMSFTRALVVVGSLLAMTAACGGGDPTAATKATALLSSTIEDLPAEVDDNEAAETAADDGDPMVRLPDSGLMIEPAAPATAAAGEREILTTSTVGATGDTEQRTAGADEAAIVIAGKSVTIDWAALPTTPYFAPADQGEDPFFHIHTNPDSDGFFLSFEMFTVWGEAWTGELGTIDISCLNPKSGTGICAYFDPDGVGPDPILGDDFGATGSMTIQRLDNSGYDIMVHELTFTDGTVFEEFSMVG